MKKMLCVLTALLLAIGLVACGKAEDAKQEKHDDTDAVGTEITEIRGKEITEPVLEDNTMPEDAQEKILIAYFTWAENTKQDDMDAMTSASVKNPGNVAMLASWIAEETGGELFSIQVTEPYPAEWDEVLNRANREKADDARPGLSGTVSDIEDIDIVFLGYPKMEYGFNCVLCV